MKRSQTAESIELPAGDPRTKLLSARLKKEKYSPDSLVQVLHLAQNLYGYLPMEVIRFITRKLRLPPSRVFGAVTFYHFFTLNPKGEHTCLVCTGTACYVKGAQTILTSIEQGFGIRDGEVTPDNRLGLQTARCLGACGLAPALVLDNEVIPRVTAQKVLELIHEKIGVPA